MSTYKAKMSNAYQHETVAHKSGASYGALVRFLGQVFRLLRNMQSKIISSSVLVIGTIILQEHTYADGTRRRALYSNEGSV